MRHGKKINHLGRTASHRKAMLSNMASSLILNKRISTTVAKAKALRKYVEPLMTRAKDDTTHSRRVVFSYLNNKESVKTLFDEVAEKIASRPGGYTRIIKTGARLGDNAEMCIMELVDYNELLLKEAKPAKSKRRSRRGGKSKKSQEATTAAPAASVEAVDTEAGATDQAEAANPEADQVQAVDEAPADEPQVVSEEAIGEGAAAEDKVAAEPTDDVVETAADAPTDEVVEAAAETPVEETTQKPEDQAEKAGEEPAKVESKETAAPADTTAVEKEDAPEVAKAPETPQEDTTESAPSGQSKDEPQGDAGENDDATDDEKKSN